jgi:hypothetical protein
MTRQINPIHAIPFYSSKFILMLSSHLHIGLSSCSFLKVPQPKPSKNCAVQISLRVGVAEDIFSVSGRIKKDTSVLQSVQTGSGTHSVSYPMRTRGSVAGGNSVFLHLNVISQRWIKRRRR